MFKKQAIKDMKLPVTTFFCVCLFLSFQACEKKELTIAPALKDLTEAVYASGNIYPEEEYQVYANADGLLYNSFVEAGDEVRKNQPLFRIESDMQNIRHQTAEEVYRHAVENYAGNSPILSEAKAQVKSARVKLENDSVNYVRFKNLWDQNATTKVDYDRATMTYSLSKNEYEARKNNLERIKKQLYLDLQNAEGQLKLTGKDAQNTFLKAMFDGIVYDIFKEPGEAVRRNEPIALLGNPEKIYLKLAVDELDVAKIKPGQEVLVKVDLFRDTVFTAKVTRVHKKMNQQDQSFRIDATFTGPKPPSFYGLNVEANIIILKKKNVLIIPKSLLAGKDSVYILTDHGQEKVKIVKGIEDFDFVEILKGLDTNSRIIKSDGK